MLSGVYSSISVLGFGSWSQGDEGLVGWQAAHMFPSGVLVKVGTCFGSR